MVDGGLGVEFVIDEGVALEGDQFARELLGDDDRFRQAWEPGVLGGGRCAGQAGQGGEKGRQCQAHAGRGRESESGRQHSDSIWGFKTRF